MSDLEKVKLKSNDLGYGDGMNNVPSRLNIYLQEINAKIIDEHPIEHPERKTEGSDDMYLLSDNKATIKVVILKKHIGQDSYAVPGMEVTIQSRIPGAAREVADDLMSKIKEFEVNYL